MLNNLETQIFSRVKAGFSSKIKAKYPDLSFTTVDKSSTKPKFPTVYIHLIGSPEIGQDLDCTTVNAVNATFQVDVTDNQSQARAKEVADEVFIQMKRMRFLAKVIPNFDNTGDIFRSVARYNRVIGSGDIF